MDKLVVISINSSWNVQNFRRGLIKALQGQGYKVVALAPRDEYSVVLSELGVDHVAIDMDSNGTSVRRDLKLLRDYYFVLKKLRPQAFLSYTAKPNVYGGIACASLGIPYIPNVSGLGSVFIEEGWLALVLRRLYRVAFRRATTVFFQNPVDLELLVDGGTVRREQAALLPGSGVDLERFAPAAEDERSAEFFTFILIARLLWDKGVGEFIAAARKVKVQLPKVRFQLLGFLDSANRTAVSRSDIDKWVEEGIIELLETADDVRPYVAAADCIVLPSYREGLPRVLLEAAAMAKPLIATDVPGCRHVVDEGENGFLCEVRDADSLASKMMKMMALSPVERRAMGRAGRLKVENEFDERLAVAKYMAALEKAVGG